MLLLMIVNAFTRRAKGTGHSTQKRENDGVMNACNRAASLRKKQALHTAEEQMSTETVVNTDWIQRKQKIANQHSPQTIPQ